MQTNAIWTAPYVRTHITLSMYRTCDEDDTRSNTDSCFVSDQTHHDISKPVMNRVLASRASAKLQDEARMDDIAISAWTL